MGFDLDIMGKKLCIIYNYAQHYRTGIFRLIDKEFNCEWFFGDVTTDIRKMDYSILTHRYHEMPRIRIGPFLFQKGVLGLLRREFSHYIILANPRSISAWLFLLLSRLFPQKRVFIWTHGWYGKENWVEVIVKKIMFHLANGGLFLYGYYAKQLMIQKGFNPDKLYVVHNSLDYDSLIGVRDKVLADDVYSNHFKNSYQNIIFIGRLTPVKKLDLLLDAIRICHDNGHYYNLTFIGSGSELDSLLGKTDVLGLVSNVWFYGPSYDDAILGKLIYNADLCVAPGNIGLTAIHSLCFGTPAITHNDFKWQMPEFEAIHPGITGAFFERDDSISLANSIVRWFEENGMKREIVRRACMEEVDRYWTPHFQIGVIKEALKI